MHVPLFKQATASQGLSSISQICPSNPSGQRQKKLYLIMNPSKLLGKDMQVPLFKQGMTAMQGSTISLHVGPDRSRGHSH